MFSYLVNKQSILFAIAWIGLVIGVIYPETKNVYQGINFVPPYLTIVFLTNLYFFTIKKEYLYISFITLLIFLFYGLTNFIFFNGNKIEIIRQLSTLSITPIAAFLFLVNFSQKTFFLNLFKVSSVFAIALLIEKLYLNDFRRESHFLGFGPITIAKLLLIGILGYLFSEEKISIKHLIMVFISLIILTIAASRGPSCSFFAIILPLLFLSKKKIIFLDPKKLFFLFFYSIALLMLQNRSISFSDLESGKTYTEVADHSLSSAGARIFAWENTIDSIFNFFPMGYGIGNWILNALDTLKFLEYPHNIFLQFLYDGGVVGLLILILLFYEIVTGIKSSNMYTYCAIFFILTSFFSGNLKDYRYIVFFILMARAHRYERK